MTVFALMLILFLKDGAVENVAETYDTRFECEQAMGRVATYAQSDPQVAGWVFLDPPCRAVPPAIKS